MRRRAFLGASALGAGAVALGGSVWVKAARDPVGHRVADPAASPGETLSQSVPEGPSSSSSPTGPTSPGPTVTASGSSYGALQPPDENGLRLPPDFVSRVVAESGTRVDGTSYRWHPAPDGGACFSVATGWIYVSNSEVQRTGGASAIRFDADGAIADAYSILKRTNRNCAGGPTPWGTWLSCEEVTRGRVFETDPAGERDAVVHLSMGRFRHEAAAVDLERRAVYLTEDEPDGCFYRFRPTDWPALDQGILEVLCSSRRTGAVTWEPVPDPVASRRPTRRQVSGAARFDGGEGAWFGEGGCWFTSKGDNRVWRYDAEESSLSIVLGRGAEMRSPLHEVDNITASAAGDVFVAEDGPEMQLCCIRAGRVVTPFARVAGHPHSEVTGPAFSPDGSRLYFSSQRGASGKDGGGVTYEVTGPFRA